MYGPQGIDVETVREGHAVELARLTSLMSTPDPSTTHGDIVDTSNERLISARMAKDIILHILDALARASDVIPPLKSTANGLLFFVTHADVSMYKLSRLRY